MSSGYNRTDVHMNSKILWHQTRDIHSLKTNEVPVLREEGRNRLPPLTCNWYPLKNKYYFFSNGVSLAILTTLQQGPCPGLVSQHKFNCNGFFCRTFVSFYLSDHFLLYSLLLKYIYDFLFVWFSLKKKRKSVGLDGW